MPTATLSASRSELIALAMKLVAPMRQEFGASVRIMNVLTDDTYARTVLDLASGSRNPRLRQDARMLDNMLARRIAASKEQDATGASRAQDTM